MTHPQVRVETAVRQAYLDGRPLQLGHREYGVLHTLVANAGHPVTIDTLYRQVWGDGPTEVRVVQQIVFYLRQKLRDTQPHAYITSVRGVGYQFTPDLAEPSTSGRFEVAGRTYEAIRWDRRSAPDGAHAFLVTAREVTR